MKELKDKIQAARKARRLTQLQVADHFGITRVSVTQWESGQTRPDQEKLPELAKLLGCSIEYLLNDEIAEIAVEQHKPNAIIKERITEKNGMIPVYGQAVGGIDGEFIMNGNILYEVMVPPNLSPHTGAYAVCVAGDSMSPRYEDGEIAYVDAHRRVRRGDYVVAQIFLYEGDLFYVYIKRFISHNSKELILEQLNPAKEMRFPSDQVESIHFIAMAGPMR